MEYSSHTTGILEAALRYARMRLPIIPLHGKVPAVRGWQRFVAAPENCHYWFETRGCNIGLRTGDSGYIVIDTDTPAAETWARAHLPATPMMALSGGGSTHRYYRRPARKEIRNVRALHGIHGLDVRGQGGFIVLPPSIHPKTGKPYAWLGQVLPPRKLPRLSPMWVCPRKRQLATSALLEVDNTRLMRRVIAYVGKIEPAVSGQGGHNKTYYAACKIADLVHGDPALTWHFLQRYNARCLPPWSERELRHKWADALKRRT